MYAEGDAVCTWSDIRRDNKLWAVDTRKMFSVLGIRQCIRRTRYITKVRVLVCFLPPDDSSCIQKNIQDSQVHAVSSGIV